MRIALATLAVLLLCAPVASAVGFQSPSKNIGCVIAGGSARCDIAKHDWATPKKPASCELDYGNGLSITRSGSRGRFVCAGDTTLGSGAILRYGNQIKSGGFTCTSRESGVTCSNRRGHGFTLSKQRYKRF